jgi:hypothetical protein
MGFAPILHFSKKVMCKTCVGIGIQSKSGKVSPKKWAHELKKEEDYPKSNLNWKFSLDLVF